MGRAVRCSEGVCVGEEVPAFRRRCGQNCDFLDRLRGLGGCGGRDRDFLDRLRLASKPQARGAAHLPGIFFFAAWPGIRNRSRKSPFCPAGSRKVPLGSRKSPFCPAWVPLLPPTTRFPLPRTGRAAAPPRWGDWRGRPASGPLRYGMVLGHVGRRGLAAAVGPLVEARSPWRRWCRPGGRTRCSRRGSGPCWCWGSSRGSGCPPWIRPGRGPGSACCCGQGRARARRS